MKIHRMLVKLACIIGLTSGTLAAGQRVFRVEGRIIAPPGAEVTFLGERTKRTVVTNRKLRYETDLPLGAYTMSVRHPKYPSLQELRRPVFSVSSPTTLVLNGSLPLGRISCDLVLERNTPAPTDEQWQERMRNACGGEDFFALPSKQGTPFQVYVRYLKRQRSEESYVYSGDEVATDVTVPVTVAYNLFTLEAEHVTYDIQKQALIASGKVVATSGTGLEQHYSSIVVNLEDGKAILIHKRSDP